MYNRLNPDIPVGKKLTDSQREELQALIARGKDRGTIPYYTSSSAETDNTNSKTDDLDIFIFSGEFGPQVYALLRGWHPDYSHYLYGMSGKDRGLLKIDEVRLVAALKEFFDLDPDKKTNNHEEQ